MVDEKQAGEETRKEVPDAVMDFELLLRDYGIKKAPIIAKNIGDTGGADIFDNPEALAKKLTKWPREIAPVYRESILEHWFKSRGVVIPEEVIQEMGMEKAQKEEAKKKKEKEKKVAEGAVWTVEVDDSGLPKIRMITDETEPGITLTEAKAAAKEIGKEREEPIVTYDEEAGRHMPNFKSAFVKQNLSAAWATAKQMDRALAEGEAIDPMDIWIEQQAKLMQLKEVMGLGTETKEKGTVGELVSALKDLQEMAREGKVGELPGWLSDPLQFIQAVKAVSGGGGEGGLPSWLSDPAQFVQTVKTVSEAGGEGGLPGWLSDPAQFVQTVKTVSGAGAEGGLPGWLSDPTQFIQTVKAVSGTGAEGGLPSWLSDPAQFVQTVKTISGVGAEGGASKPDWLSDPAQFLKVMREVSGEGKGDDAIKTELVELRKTLTDMQEDRRREEIASLQTQIRQQAEAYQQQINQVMDKVGEMSHPVTGRTEMDIIHEVATEGIGAIKTEAAGMRGLIKDAIAGGALPLQKSPEQREERKEGYRKALKKDQEIEELGRKLFFSEG